MCFYEKMYGCHNRQKAAMTMYDSLNHTFRNIYVTWRAITYTGSFLKRCLYGERAPHLKSEPL